MRIIQLEDKNLAHYSYVLFSEDAMAVIDPARDPQPYYELAARYHSSIIAVIETHTHADFVSSHLEIHETTGAVIYASKLSGAEYKYHPFDEGEVAVIGKATLKAINTPGHSPDSISVLAINEQGKEEAVFTGDTLFIGDCGRPDLRETDGVTSTAREKLASQMYFSLRNTFMKLPDDVLVYPAHGAGSLCGKSLSEKNTSTIGNEKAGNWCLQDYSESDFVQELLAGQPFIPRYFSYDVELNKKGAPKFLESVSVIRVSEMLSSKLDNHPVIDTRNQQLFEEGHLKNAIHLMNDLKFETWLGSIIGPYERFYLIAEDKSQLLSLIKRTAKIGYEKQIEQAFAVKAVKGETMNKLDVETFWNSTHDFTLVDVRNPAEVKEKVFFEDAENVPLYELRERVDEIPADKPVVVFCTGGYRSAAATSIIKGRLNGSTEVFDLGEAIKAL